MNVRGCCYYEKNVLYFILIISLFVIRNMNNWSLIDKLFVFIYKYFTYNMYFIFFLEIIIFLL